LHTAYSSNVWIRSPINAPGRRRRPPSQRLYEMRAPIWKGLKARTLIAARRDSRNCCAVRRLGSRGRAAQPRAAPPESSSSEAAVLSRSHPTGAKAALRFSLTRPLADDERLPGSRGGHVQHRVSSAATKLSSVAERVSQPAGRASISLPQSPFAFVIAKYRGLFPPRERSAARRASDTAQRVGQEYNLAF